MDNDKTRSVLEKLVAVYPKPLNVYAFNVPEAEEQEFRNFLLELNQRDLLDAKFLKGNGIGTHGLPIAVCSILITKAGREFVEGKDEKNSVSQTINIQNTSGPVHIAGQDININGADADRLVERLLDNIETSDLPPEKKTSLVESVKSMTAAVTPKVLAGLVLESAKSFFTDS